MHHAVFPGGRRIRPRLALAVGAALAETPEDRELVLRAACSVELVHCASLVHDDLPCFDDAEVRRGRLSVHQEHGESTAVLVGDALLALGFELLAAPGPHPVRALALLRELARATGSQRGIIGGQAMECELPVSAPGLTGPDAVQLNRYHHLKTTPLFCFATSVGALASGETLPARWRQIGHWLGAAFQLADDLIDRCSGGGCGKPVGRDAHLGRPNAVEVLGEEGARLQLRANLQQARLCAESCIRQPEETIGVIDEVERVLAKYCQGAK